MLVRCAAASGAGRLGERWPAGDIPNDALFGPEYRVVPGTDPALNPICLAEGCDRALLAIRKICFLQLSLIDQTRRRHIARLHWCPHGGRDQPPDFLCTGNASPFPCRDFFGIRAEDPHEERPQRAAVRWGHPVLLRRQRGETRTRPSPIRPARAGSARVVCIDQTSMFSTACGSFGHSIPSGRPGRPSTPSP